MTEPTIWDTQHGPVLRAAVHALNADRNFGGVRLPVIIEATGLEPEDVVAACRALEATGYVEMRWNMPPGRAASVVRVDERAQQYAGAWPTPESGFDRLIAALEHIAENTEDDDERTQLRQFASFLKTSARKSDSVLSLPS